MKIARIFYRLLIAVPLKMYRKYGRPKWILVGQMLKLFGKKANGQLLFPALILNTNRYVGCTVTVQLDSLVQKFLTILEKVMVSENNSYIQTMFPWISEIFLVKASSGYSLPLFSNSNRPW